MNSISIIAFVMIFINMTYMSYNIYIHNYNANDLKLDLRCKSNFKSLATVIQEFLKNLYKICKKWSNYYNE